MAPSGPPIRLRGYSLIELLVVLVIVGVLAAIAVAGLRPNTPSAVKGAVQELEASLQTARSTAISNGRDVNILFQNDANGRLQMLVVNPLVYDPADPAKAAQGTFYTHTFETTWQRYANFTSTDPITPGESTPAKNLVALKTLGFTGWVNNLDRSTKTPVGLSSRGFPQLVDAGGNRTAATGGVWLGIVGQRINATGVPYGFAFITDTGIVGAYYKPDSKVEDTTTTWQRLE